MKIATRRAVLLQAWRAAQKRIERDGIAQLSAAEEAGRLLAKYELAIAAHTLCSSAEARGLIDDVMAEEDGRRSSNGRNSG